MIPDTGLDVLEALATIMIGFYLTCALFVFGLAGGLASHRPELLDGVGLILGIDRFMSEARAVTNFAGNSVATVLVGAWT